MEETESSGSTWLPFNSRHTLQATAYSEHEAPPWKRLVPGERVCAVSPAGWLRYPSRVSVSPSTASSLTSGLKQTLFIPVSEATVCELSFSWQLLISSVLIRFLFVCFDCTGCSLWHAAFLVAACKLLVAACMRDLVPGPGIEPGPPVMGARSLTHWTTREVPPHPLLKHLLLFPLSPFPPHLHQYSLLDSKRLYKTSGLNE